LVPTTAAFSHDPGLQTVPATCRRQAPLPSQVPSRPQVDASDGAQSVGIRGGPPAGMTVQIPGEPWRSQARQVSVHALLQQTPSAQKPVWQSLLQAQASPFIRGAPAPTRQVDVIVSSDASPASGRRVFDDPPHAPAAKTEKIATIVRRRAAEGAVTTSGR
jgi:hypothetical protein